MLYIYISSLLRSRAVDLPGGALRPQQPYVCGASFGRVHDVVGTEYHRQLLRLMRRCSAAAITNMISYIYSTKFALTVDDGVYSWVCGIMRWQCCVRSSCWGAEASGMASLVVEPPYHGGASLPGCQPGAEGKQHVQHSLHAWQVLRCWFGMCLIITAAVALGSGRKLGSGLAGAGPPGVTGAATGQVSYSIVIRTPRCGVRG
jgi:hypothetical protein